MTTRRVATALLVAGALALAYAVTILVWRDPATDLYTRFQQQRLESALEAELEAWARADDGRGRPAAVDDGADPAEAAKAARAEVRADARRFAGELELGQAFGRIRIPSIDVEAIVVHGTRWGPDLSRGPGHYERTTVPGLGRTVGIAGHRTTFGAPFR
ncbi:MAG TPA: sortase, partial [Gaiellaceae bacterium]|nr:sortase [Gaiellaceae bacterium]